MKAEFPSQHGIRILRIIPTFGSAVADGRLLQRGWVSQWRTGFHVFDDAAKSRRFYCSKFTCSLSDNHLHLDILTWTEHHRYVCFIFFPTELVRCITPVPKAVLYYCHIYESLLIMSTMHSIRSHHYNLFVWLHISVKSYEHQFLVRSLLVVTISTIADGNEFTGFLLRTENSVGTFSALSDDTRTACSVNVAF